MIMDNLKDEDLKEVIEGGIYKEGLFIIFRFYQTFYFDVLNFLEVEKGDFNNQVMVKFREELGKQIIEDGLYGNDYINWKKKEELRREKEEVKEISSLTFQICQPLRTLG
jgi:hypothetical protein